MSLINQMLQDLDSRGNDGVGKGAMYAQIRSVPEIRKPRANRWLWLAAFGALFACILTWQWMTHSMKRSTTGEHAAQISVSDLKLSSELTLSQIRPMAESPQTQSIQSAAIEQTAERMSATSPESSNIPQADKPQIAPHVGPPDAQKAPPVNSLSAPMAISTALSILSKDDAPANVPKNATVNAAGINKQINELTLQQRAENEYRKAALLVQQGKVSEAFPNLEQALQFDPQHVAARQALVGLLIDGKRQDEAIRRLQEGLRLDVAQPGLAMILARLQLEKGELRHALETLQQTLPYGAERPDYQAFLAALLQRDGRHKEAIEHYQFAVRQAPQNGVWWMGMGISLQAENRLSEAREAFGRAKSSNVLSAELQAFVDQKLDQLKR